MFPDVQGQESYDNTGVGAASDIPALEAAHPKLLKVFSELDKADSGTITRSDLQAELSNEAADALIELGDINGSHDLDFREFTTRFGHVKDPSPAKVIAEGLHSAKKAGLLSAPLSELIGHAPEPSTEHHACGDCAGDCTVCAALTHAAAKENDVAALFAAGAAGGLLSRCVTAPLDRIRLTRQAGVQASWKELLTAVRQRAGWAALWRGNLTNCLKATPFAGVVCATYCSSLQAMTGGVRAADAHERLAAGACSGALAAFVTQPLDVIRTRLAVIRALPNPAMPHTTPLPTAERSIWRCMRDIALHEGVRGFWRGGAPGVASAALFTGIMQWSFDSMVQAGMAPGNASWNPFPVRWATQDVSLTMLAACAAGVAAHGCTHPLETVRRRMQMAEPHTRGATQAMYTVRRMVATEGSRGLWAGLGAALAKVVPAVAVNLAVREAMLGRTAPIWATVHTDPRALPRALRANGSR